MKKYKERNETRELEISNAFLSLKMMFFGLENGNNDINSVDLIVNFLWPRRTPQSEFSIKSYDRLKLRWSIFDFYSLSSFFLISLTSLIIYEYIKRLIIRDISVFEF
jgi:hypothetical protein